ncbi:MAG TPA: acyltransferase [Solirubrobacteraceae bacterium]
MVGPAKRIRSLDGLRGLAALVVVFHHTLLASAPRLAGAYAPGQPAPRGLLAWLFTYTPLHIVWAGQEFVVVFFVLSGFVLSLPAAQGRALSPVVYYPSRFIRLYAPVWGALAFAALMHVVVSHGQVTGASWWLNAHSQPLGVEGLISDGTLGYGAGNWAFTSVLWSLRWEVIFSLALPPLLWLFLRARRPLSWGVPAVCVLALLCHESNEYLLELPPFLLGMSMAFSLESIERMAEPLRAPTSRSRWLRVALLIACACGLTADWWLPGSGVDAVLLAAGACMSVLAALVVEPLAELLCSRPMQWTGKRSYSLYLVHEPLVVALAFALGGRSSAVLFVPLAVVLSLAACAGFFRLVEYPSHRFARWLGAYAGQANERRLSPSAAGAGHGGRPPGDVPLPTPPFVAAVTVPTPSPRDAG